MAAIMDAKTPAAGGEKKPCVKYEGRTNNQHDRGHSNNRRGNTPRKETFLGADPDLCGHVFEAKHNRIGQAAMPHPDYTPTGKATVNTTGHVVSSTGAVCPINKSRGRTLFVVPQHFAIYDKADQWYLL